ncbi:hypothetical protein CDO44_14350 [Pigmentiphaga sp. NML080357]|nr:hypothetical protein CDO44_14350 [Pigmentiphaga sp. NML080357]
MPRGRLPKPHNDIRFYSFSSMPGLSRLDAMSDPGGPCRRIPSRGVRMQSRFVISLSLLLSAWLPGAAALAAEQGWKPEGKIEYIVPSGPGAALDMAARRLGHILEIRKLAPAVVVTNKPGGSNAIALNVLQQNAGNPHYLTTLGSTLLTGRANGTLDVTYSDFTPIAVLLDEFVTVAVRADSPIKTGRDLIEALRRDPQSLSIGVASSLGNHIHIGIARPLKLGGVDIGRLTVVPFKSSAESLNALLGGHLDVVSSSTPNVVAHIKSGRIRVLAVDAPQRLEGTLAVAPTWKEQGIDVVGLSSQGVLAPKGITPRQRDYWVEALREATRTPEWQEFLQTNQLREHFLPPDQAVAYLDRQYAEIRAVLKDLRLVGD